MIDLLKLFQDLAHTLLGSGPGAPLTIGICIAIGYVVKSTPLDNGWIPLIVLAVGTGFFPQVVSPAIVPHDTPKPEIFLYGSGFLVGCVSWALHRYAIKYVEDWLAAKFGGAEKEKPLGP